MKRRVIPREEGVLLADIYCNFCKGETTWVVHRVYNPAADCYSWTVTCLGCKCGSFDFAYEPRVHHG